MKSQLNEISRKSELMPIATYIAIVQLQKSKNSFTSSDSVSTIAISNRDENHDTFCYPNILILVLIIEVKIVIILNNNK